MGVLRTFLESSINFLFNNLKKQYKVQSERKTLSKFEFPKTQFKITVRDQMACKTHLK